MFTNPIYYILIILCLAAVGYWYYRQKRKGLGNKEPKKEDGEEEEGTILCRIADNITCAIGDEFITKAQADIIKNEHGNLGRQWFRYGKRVYGLNRYKEEGGGIKLRPITIPSQITNAPSELHNDMQHPELEIIMNDLMKDDGKGFMETYAWIFPWIVALAFLAFIWSQA